jgi:hypothetical protein
MQRSGNFDMQARGDAVEMKLRGNLCSMCHRCVQMQSVKERQLRAWPQSQRCSRNLANGRLNSQHCWPASIPGLESGLDAGEVYVSQTIMFEKRLEILIVRESLVACG